MERLWTPWRNEYVVSDKTEGCFLCSKPDQQSDEANFILFRSSLVYALLNTFPYNTAHLMVSPYSHTADLAGLDFEISSEMWSLVQRCTGILQDEYHPDGFNIGLNLGQAGGAGVVDHLHVHIVPRWLGDTNFMPVVGEAKVLPETLEQTYHRLISHFSK